MHLLGEPAEPYASQHFAHRGSPGLAYVITPCIGTKDASCIEVRGWIGERTVRVLEVTDGWALVQPWDEPRTWELVRADLVVVEHARRAVLGGPEAKA